MATLLLVAAGAALGAGRIVGAAAALLGQAIDGQIFGSRGHQEGHRLTDLRLQTSTYGTAVPRLYGAMRVAGTVIWSTDLLESVHHSGGGKRSPSVTTYSYAASFAVALSSRPIRGVGRIWADGNLLRGAAGDGKTGMGGFRWCAGEDDQSIDPLMAAAVGVNRCPAYRGLAYALFENLELGDYGNRIPALTLEVFADDGPVLVEAIAHDASGGAIAANGSGAMVGGFAATGRSAGEALSPLFDCFGLRPVVRGGDIGLIGDLGGAGAGAQIGARQLARAANGKKAQMPRHVRDKADAAPVREEVLDLPATLEAGAARQQAELRVRRLWSGRSRIEAQCGWSLLAQGPGDVVALDGQEGLWRIERSQWEEGLVNLSLRRVGAAIAAVPAASSGTVIRQQDLVHGPSRIALIELPSAGDMAADAPLAMVAAAGESAGWRSAGLYIRNMGDGTLDYVGASAPPAIMGRVVTPPSPGASPHLCDLASALVVELLHAGMALTGASELQLAQGANLCWVGGELIQFGVATPLGGTSYRLERLWRGRRGTEALIGQHGADEGFVLIEQARLFQLPASRVHIGDHLGVSAIGIGDLAPVEAELLLTGAAMLPMAPVHLRASEEAGGLRLSWARRSRTGWRWSDGVDAPLGEELERYELVWSDAAGPFRRVELGTPSYLYPSSEQAADLAAGHGGAVKLTIRQIGTHGIGPAATIGLNI